MNNRDHLPPSQKLSEWCRENKKEKPLLDQWYSIFIQMKIPEESISEMIQEIQKCDFKPHIRIFPKEKINLKDLYKEVAQKLQIQYPEKASLEKLINNNNSLSHVLQKSEGALLLEIKNGEKNAKDLVIGPYILDLTRLEREKVLAETKGQTLYITAYEDLKESLHIFCQPVLEKAAVKGLYETQAKYCAQYIFTQRSCIAAGVMFGSLICLAFWQTEFIFFFLHILGLFFLFISGILKFIMAFSAEKAAQKICEKSQECEGKPVYSILVPLKDEAVMIPQLLNALKEILWPEDKLEIKLVCEADDKETQEAINSHELRERVEIIIVPPGQPQTKPKALNYALPFTTGEFIVIYDAEDRPDPQQLHEAWQCFNRTHEDVACLQAPLKISNKERDFLARMFAFEYLSLFHRVLPWLAQKGLWLPLGGTSNHFRRETLEDIGAWDPFNVAEDVDISIRLVRYSCRIGVLSSPTLEEAPCTWKIWMNQRTRWQKGWIQTYLVHMRNPLLLMQEIGVRSFFILQILMLDRIILTTIHLFWILILGWSLYTWLGTAEIPAWKKLLFSFDIGLFLLNYAGFLYLGYSGMKYGEDIRFFKIFSGTLVYWGMISLAALKALPQLITAPHYWNKTPHRPFRATKNQDHKPKCP